MRRYLCGVPKHKCGGAETATVSGLGYSIKTHADPVEAFRCHGKWLVSQGYSRVGTREFQDPETRRILVLTKARKFGAPMRLGKSSGGITCKRTVPKRRGKMGKALGGTIVG